MPRIALVLGLALTLLASCGKTTYREVPETLLGRWTSSAPSYAERYLELERDRISFGTGEASPDSHLVFRVEEEPAQGQLLYTIWYRDGEGQELAFSVTLDPGRESLELPHRRQATWRRE